MVRFLRFIDKYVGRIIVILLLIFRKFGKKKSNHRKILVIKLWAMGDSILTLPLIKGINESFVSFTVDVLTRDRVKDVFECYSINHIYSLDSFSDIRKLFRTFRQYDYVFDCEPYMNLSAILSFLLGNERIGFSNQFRSRLYSKTVFFKHNQHMVQNYFDMLRIIGKQFDTQNLEKLSIEVELQQKVDKFIFEKLNMKIIVGITPGISESSKNRMWFENRFAELADKIIEQLNCEVIFIDSITNSIKVENIISQMKNIPLNTIGMFSLKETFYLISKCEVFVCNDTGPMHVAAAQGVKTVGLFGPNTPVLWAPYGEKNISIYETKLKPSIINDKGVFKEGNREEFMGPITVNQVFDAVKKLLS